MLYIKVKGMIIICVIMFTTFVTLLTSLPICSPSIHFLTFSLSMAGGINAAAYIIIINIQAFHTPISKSGMNERWISFWLILMISIPIVVSKFWKDDFLSWLSWIMDTLNRKFFNILNFSNRGEPRLYTHAHTRERSPVGPNYNSFYETIKDSKFGNKGFV